MNRIPGTPLTSFSAGTEFLGCKNQKTEQLKTNVHFKVSSFFIQLKWKICFLK